MAALESDGGDFDEWISERCRALNTDEAVFGPYIKSIVEGDEELEEKVEALDGILAEIADGSSDGKLNVQGFREEILIRWDQQVKKALLLLESSGKSTTTDLDSKLENILKINDTLVGANTKADTVEQSGDALRGFRNGTQDPDPTLRAAILNQYKDDPDDDELDHEEPAASASGSSKLERNTNAERLVNEMKEKREKEKADSAKKRERDKEDRAKQKQQAQERKDKAKKKAAKVERKR